MRKIIIILSIIIFTGCSSEIEEKETILFLHYFTGTLSHGINELSEIVNKKQKNLTLVATPLDHEEFKVSIRIQLESKNPPDLFSYWAGARTQYLVENDKISPINEIFDSKINPDDFEESVLNACSYNGEIYLLPLTRHFVGFFYNKEIFEKYGLNVPQNWDDLMTVAETLKLNNVIPFSIGAKNRWPAQFWFDYLLLRTAGFDYRQQLMNKEADYTDAEVQKVMKIWKGLIDKGYFNKNYKVSAWDDAAKMIVENKTAMTLMGTWTIPYLDEEGMRPDVDYGFFPFPHLDSSIENVALGPIDGVLLSKGSNNKELSREILYHFAQPETQQAFNVISGSIAPHKKVSNDVYSPIQLKIKKLIQKSSYWAFNYDLATEPITSEAGLDFFVNFLETPDDYENLLIRLQKRISQN